MDTCITENVTNHNTNEYDITGKDHGEQLVLRRGQHFFLAVAFDRPYDKSTDRFQICLEIGKSEYLSVTVGLTCYCMGDMEGHIAKKIGHGAYIYMVNTEVSSFLLEGVSV